MALVYDESYLAYNHGELHPLQPRRVKLAVELIRKTGLARFADLLAPRPATDAELGLVHGQAYIDLVRRLGHGEEMTRPEQYQAAAAGYLTNENQDKVRAFADWLRTQPLGESER